MSALKKEISMLNFISFGSGSSGNCYILYSETDCLMIDCGVGMRLLKKYFQNYNLPIKMIKHIILTHDHADHVKAVGSISKDLNIPVYATGLVHQGIRKNLAVHRKIDSKLVVEIEKQKRIEIGEFSVTPFSVPHDSTDCVGYCIEHEGISFVLVTDCGQVTEEILKYISKANYLVLESNHEPEKLIAGSYPAHLKKRILGATGHLSNEDCGKALVEGATSKLKHVWLCHLSDENNHPELARKTIENILRTNGIIPNVDFVLDILKRKTPSEIQPLV